MKRRLKLLIVVIFSSGLLEPALTQTGMAADTRDTGGAKAEPAETTTGENTADPSIMTEAVTTTVTRPVVVPLLFALTSPQPAVARAFVKAWKQAALGTANVEAVVLIFRMADGSYRADTQGYTNERKRFTFKWNPAAIAIVHTHPNSVDPRPTPIDEQVADKLGVPMFTITNRGMWMYDPKTKKTDRVRDNLDWLPAFDAAGGLRSPSVANTDDTQNR